MSYPRSPTQEAVNTELDPGVCWSQQEPTLHSVSSPWELEIGHSGSIYKSANAAHQFPAPGEQTVNIYHHSTDSIPGC